MLFYREMYGHPWPTLCENFISLRLDKKAPQKKEKKKQDYKSSGSKWQITGFVCWEEEPMFNLPLLNCLFYKYYMINVEEFLLSSDSTYGPAGVYIWAVCVSGEQTAACGLSCSSSHCYGTATCKLQRNWKGIVTGTVQILYLEVKNNNEGGSGGGKGGIAVCGRGRHDWGRHHKFQGKGERKSSTGSLYNLCAVQYHMQSCQTLELGSQLELALWPSLAPLHSQCNIEAVSLPTSTFRIISQSPILFFGFLF